MNIGEQLLKLRKEKNLSQEEVADQLNVTRQTVSKWETNQSTPDFDKIMPICQLYGITSDELLTGVKIEKETEVVEKTATNTKKAAGIVIGILLYFVAVAWITISIPVFMMNPIVSTTVFLLICGVATSIIIYVNIVFKKEKQTIIEDKNTKIAKQINEVIACIVTVIYFLISFYTMAWHITWIIWVIYAMIEQIVKLLFMLKGDFNEK